MGNKIDITLRVWRQKSENEKGGFETYEAKMIDTEMSFLEMLDHVNEDLIKNNKEPIAFDHDCREGICGTCGAVINGQPHGPIPATTLCQLHMRHFRNNQIIIIEPFRSRAFPIIRDLVVDRSSFDRVIMSHGFISVKTGSAPEANTIPISQKCSEKSMDAAACIGCGACVAACPNGSAMLFVGAKVSHLNLLPQGKIEGKERVKSMVLQMDREGFGNCSNEYKCEATCPKSISVSTIALMNKEFLQAIVKS
jgi:succinate dehydrogenase / fumarate reductase, iron-sulfur subunit